MIKSVLASMSCLVLAHAANAAEVPFDLYKSACLETAAQPDQVRALASAQHWGALSAEERDRIAPGNAEAVEGWAVSRSGARLLVSVTSAQLRGGVATGDRSSCTVSGAQGEDAKLIKAYSEYLKRKPAEDSSDGGARTTVWSIHAGGSTAMHYYFGSAPGAKSGGVYSVSVLKK
jgi:hypothetical protein